MADFFGIQRPAGNRNDIVRGHVLAFVDQQNACDRFRIHKKKGPALNEKGRKGRKYRGQ